MTKNKFFKASDFWDDAKKFTRKYGNKTKYVWEGKKIK